MAEPTPLHSAAEHAEFSIRELCRQFDVTPRTLRFYEDQGLLEPRRRGQTRLYSPADRVRLGLILRGKPYETLEYGQTKRTVASLVRARWHGEGVLLGAFASQRDYHRFGGNDVVGVDAQRRGEGADGEQQ